MKTTTMSCHLHPKMCVNYFSFLDSAVQKDDKYAGTSDVHFEQHKLNTKRRQSTENTQIFVKGNGNTVVSVAPGGTFNFFTIGTFITSHSECTYQKRRV